MPGLSGARLCSAEVTDAQNPPVPTGPVGMQLGTWYWSCLKEVTRGGGCSCCPVFLSFWSAALRGTGVGSGAGVQRGPSLAFLLPCVPILQEEELIELLARHCHVQLGASSGSNAIQDLLPSCIPPKLYKTKTPEKWTSLVTAAQAKVSSEPAHKVAGPYGWIPWPLKNRRA